jgi:hypothetical protein
VLTQCSIETLLLHLHNTEISLYEIALARSAAPPSTDGPDFKRLDFLYACLRATNSWFDIFLAIPPAHYIGFSISILTQMAHCIIVLYRLSTFSHPDWDLGLVRQTLDLSTVLEQLIQKFAQIRVAAGIHDDSRDENNIYCSTRRRFEAIKSWWDGRGVPVAEPRRAGGVAGGDLIVGGEWMEAWDDSWLDIFGLRDVQF